MKSITTLILVFFYDDDGFAPKLLCMLMCSTGGFNKWTAINSTGFDGILCFNKNVRIVYTYTMDHHSNSLYTSYKYIAAYV